MCICQERERIHKGETFFTIMYIVRPVDCYDSKKVTNQVLAHKSDLFPNLYLSWKTLIKNPTENDNLSDF